jgi:hypothetical protein
VDCTGESHELTDEEGILLLVRIIVTLCGPLILCFFLYSIVSTFEGWVVVFVVCGLKNSSF